MTTPPNEARTATGKGKPVHHAASKVRFSLLLSTDEPRASATVLDRASRIAETVMADAGFRDEIREAIDLWWPIAAAKVDADDAGDRIILDDAPVPMTEAGDEYRALLKEAHDRFVREREEWARQRDDLLETLKAGSPAGEES